MKGKMSIYYDDEGDYLEIFIEGNSPTYGEEIGNDTTLFKKEETNEVVGISILNFKKRTRKMNDIKLDLPLDIGLFSRSAN